jgi:hypothetical protein
MSSLITNNALKRGSQWAICSIKKSIRTEEYSMPNKTYALEWLLHARRNMETARLLLKENHFTDSIAIEIHQIFLFCSRNIVQTNKCIHRIVINFGSPSLTYKRIPQVRD